MQNLLIIEDNLIYSHFLVNSICKELNNIRLYSIETSRYKWNRYYKLYRRK